MPPRDWKFRISDILQAIAKIHRYTNGTTYEAFCSDERTIDAVVRNLEIIGEAARHVPADIQTRYPRVPWRDMQDMRNVISHAYFEVRLSIVWDTVHEDLPPLVPLLQEILEKEP